MIFFKKRNRFSNFALQTKHRGLHGITLPPNEIDILASDEQLQESIEKVRQTWTRLGGDSAHFSVITNEQYLPDSLEANIDEFWSSGQLEAEVALTVFDRYKSQKSGSDAVCVEYGCGVGRVTFGLADHVTCVHAYDVSDKHLLHAEQRADELSTENITFHHCADSFFQALEPCDLFYSKIVFQHNPPHIILYLVKKVLESLNLGGVAIFQVPVYKVGYRFKLKKWLKSKSTLDMEMHCLPQHYIFQAIADANCVLREVWEDNATGAPDKFISNTFVVQKN